MKSILTEEVTAKFNPNEIAARYSDRSAYGLGHHLTISCPDGWEDVKKLTRRVLRHDGRAYTFIGWNSDRNECFFRSTSGNEVTATL